MSVATYPVHVDATLDPGMSRWLWLVKWLLAVPHYVVLFFLWVAFVVVSVLAFFAIVLTGRYPPRLFEFNVGVLRWSWRVAYYTYGALGTDRYPPFTLAEVADYPAHFEVDRPERLSRGLVLVKWWLLAIPHYVVVGIFVGGGTWATWQASGTSAGAPGLIGVLVVVAGVVLLFSGRYPQQLFDFVLGMNRWALRVAAYAGLMTDQYPPFRLDMGGHEPVGTMTVPSPPEAPPSPPARRRGWTAGRVASSVFGVVVGLASLGLLGAGGAATWATNTQRDLAGYLTSGARGFSTASYALTSDTIDLGNSTATIAPSDILGTLRVRVSAVEPARSVFVGIGRTAAVDAYLRGVDHLVVRDWAGSDTLFVGGSGGRSPSAPAASRLWVAKAAGVGTQTLTWRPSGGAWTVVVMNPDAAAGLAVSADVGATVPDLGWIAVGLFVAGGLLLLAAVTLIAVPVVRASR